MTHFQLLRNYFQQGYPTEEKDNTKRPYALPHVKSLYADTWELAVARVSYRSYLQETNAFEEARESPGFYATINQANPVMAAPEPEQDERGDGTTGPCPAPQAHLMPVKGSHDQVPGNAKGDK